MSRVRRFGPWALVSAFVLALLAYGVISYRVADGVTNLERRPLGVAAETIASTHEAVSFQATDGLLLKGWLFTAAPGPGAQPTPPDKAVVFVHGRGQNRVVSSFRPDLIAQRFLAGGWDVLLFDLRGHGESQGDRYSLGQYEPRDIVGAVDFVAGRTGIARQRIAVIGESLGAGSAIMAVQLDPTIGPVVADSAYADGYTVVSEVGQNYTHLPAWFTPGIAVVSRVFFGLDVWQVRPAEVVRAHPERAWLFIACDNDLTVYPHHAAELKAASTDPDTELWMASGCGHVQAFTTHPDEWASRVFAFLDREVVKRAGAP